MDERERELLEGDPEKERKGEEDFPASSGAGDTVPPQGELTEDPTVKAEETENEKAPELNSDPDPAVEVQEDRPPVTEAEETERTFTQSQVNDMMGRVREETRDRTFRYVYDRYGVKDEGELDERVGNAQRYDFLDNEYKTYRTESERLARERDGELSSIKEQLALLQSGVDKERYDDVRYILKGKELDVTPDNIMAELATHPEWKGASQKDSPVDGKFTREPESRLEVPKQPVLGNDMSKSPVSDEDEAMRMFGLNR